MSFGKRVMLKFYSVVGTRLAERGGARFGMGVLLKFCGSRDDASVLRQGSCQRLGIGSLTSSVSQRWYYPQKNCCSKNVSKTYRKYPWC